MDQIDSDWIAGTRVNPNQSESLSATFLSPLCFDRISLMEEEGIVCQAGEYQPG